MGLWFQRANHSYLQLEGRINLEDDTERGRIWEDSGEIRSPGRDSLESEHGGAFLCDHREKVGSVKMES